MTTPYREGWLAGVRFAADAIRAYAEHAESPDSPLELDHLSRCHLTSVAEGLALGATLRETEWELQQ